MGVGEHLVSPAIMNTAGGVQLGGATYPQIMLSCQHCGHVRYFNYVLLTSEETLFDRGMAEQPDG